MLSRYNPLSQLLYNVCLAVDGRLIYFIGFFFLGFLIDSYYNTSVNVQVLHLFMLFSIVISHFIKIKLRNINEPRVIKQLTLQTINDRAEF